ncbi:MAG: ribonuclease P protein component [Bacteroidales bacterium]|nr:ribonuclease P protein component [Bacteroidales bacterium]
MNYEFPKSERLCSKKLIEALFEGGHKSMSAYPIRAVFMQVGEAADEQDKVMGDGKETVGEQENKVIGEQENKVTDQEAEEIKKHEADVREDSMPAVQVMMSVSKRHFKHAVDRNRVKRQLREAYRLNKHILTPHLEGKHIVIAFIWLSDNLFESSVLQTKMQKLLHRISEEI